MSNEDALSDLEGNTDLTGSANMVSLPMRPAAAIMSQQTEATRWQSASILASAVIAASGRQHSVQQALDIARDFHFALFPVSNSAAYIEWAKTKHERLNKVHGQP
jgi:hypothetical protein